MLGTGWEYYRGHEGDSDGVESGGGSAASPADGARAEERYVSHDTEDGGGWWRGSHAGDITSSSGDDERSDDGEDDGEDDPEYIDDLDNDEWDEGEKQTVAQRARVALFVSRSTCAVGAWRA